MSRLVECQGLSQFHSRGQPAGMKLVQGRQIFGLDLSFAKAAGRQHIVQLFNEAGALVMLSNGKYLDHAVLRQLHDF